ncbi:putative bifunctional diguanylate cyclase/phosphodiesterase [Pararhizobium mangrovi]|uniref:EAL domain-containing protein n=1 Tax=Pararhizobium mangrovi TaxID=2590452 RepID=A0A506U962_9HYPH|nr:EAL domain-containing protein [Pararhizobium mangrovi]TPW28377.1 EAL domain-containing protein [Pararhizobium mangrovi]
MSRILDCIFLKHDLSILLLAVVICNVGAMVTVRLYRRAVETDGFSRTGWHFLAAVCGGAAIWTTHFIAMLGYRPGVSVHLEPTLTIGSIFLAIAGTWIGFLISTVGRSVVFTVMGGVAVALAIIAMHFAGMSAYRVAGTMLWSPGYLMLALALALVFSVAAMLAARRWTKGRARHIAALCLAFAVKGLHFVAMSAMIVEPAPGVVAGVGGLENATPMALAVTIAGLLVIGTGLSSYLIDNRLRANTNEQLRHMALHDPLTGLANRTTFHLRLDEMLAADHEPRLAVVGIDLDRFKEINDGWGHAAGDEALRILAERLRTFAEERFHVARIAGDEFAAILPFESEEELAATIHLLADLFRKSLRIDLASRIGTIEFEVGASLGIAVSPLHGADPDTLVSNADLAMYRAKNDPGGTLCYYDPRMGEEVREERMLCTQLAHAIENDELEVHYQVQKSLTDDSIRGYEALLRWTHPTLGPISPGVFIPLAEANGLIVELGEWVLRRACAKAAEWEEPHGIAVNLSAVQLAQPDLPGLIRTILHETGLAGRRLELELTETALVRDRARSLRIMGEIKALGVRVALDDFGTGYSSLETLRLFPIDRIKLDRSFVDELSGNETVTPFVAAVLALGRSLSIPVLAEGIETDAQLALLRSQACEEGQGYFLGRPGPPSLVFADSWSARVA